MLTVLFLWIAHMIILWQEIILWIGVIKAFMNTCSVVSDSLLPYGLSPTRLLCPWASPGKNTACSPPGLPWPPPGDLSNPGIKPVSRVSCIAGGFFTAEPLSSAQSLHTKHPVPNSLLQQWMAQCEPSNPKAGNCRLPVDSSPRTRTRAHDMLAEPGPRGLWTQVTCTSYDQAVELCSAVGRGEWVCACAM